MQSPSPVGRDLCNEVIRVFHTVGSTASFDASAWAKGAAPLGDGEARRQTVILYGGDASNESLVACFRRLVTIEDASNIAKYWYRPGCGGARLPWRARSDGT